MCRGPLKFIPFFAAIQRKVLSMAKPWAYPIGLSLSENSRQESSTEIGRAENQGLTRSRIFPFEGVMGLTSFHALAMPRSIR